MRDGANGHEVLLVHRPAYDDWSFPKGKALEDEDYEVCALREVEEETGLRCELLFELPFSSYRDAEKRPKLVRYWAMRAVGGEAAPATEVDELRWVPLGEIEPMLKWPGDRRVLAGLAAALQT